MGGAYASQEKAQGYRIISNDLLLSLAEELGVQTSVRRRAGIMATNC